MKFGDTSFPLPPLILEAVLESFHVRGKCKSLPMLASVPASPAFLGSLLLSLYPGLGYKFLGSKNLGFSVVIMVSTGKALLRSNG